MKSIYDNAQTIQHQNSIKEVLMSNMIGTQELVLQSRDGSYFVYSQVTSSYEGPFINSHKAKIASIKQFCPDLIESVPETLSKVQIEQLYQTEVDTIIEIGDYNIRSHQAIEYDRDAKIVTMFTPVRLNNKLHAEFSPLADILIHLLFGDRHYELAKDYLSLIPRTDRPLGILYLDGLKASGKTVLANAIANLWNGSPTKLQDLQHQFRPNLRSSPVFIVDEIAINSSTTKGMFHPESLKEVVTLAEHECNSKFRNPITMKGYARIVVSANNKNALNIEQSAGKFSLDALLQRIAYVNVIDPSASNYIKELKQRLSEEEMNHLIKNGLSNHILWLSENHIIDPSRRDSDQARFMAWPSGDLFSGGSGATAKMMFVEAIASYVSANEHLDALPIMIKGDHLYLHWSSFKEEFKPHAPDFDGTPSLALVRSLMSQLVSSDVDPSDPLRVHRVDGKLVRCYKLSIQALAEVLEQSDMILTDRLMEVFGLMRSEDEIKAAAYVTRDWRADLEVALKAPRKAPKAKQAHQRASTKPTEPKTLALKVEPKQPERAHTDLESTLLAIIDAACDCYDRQDNDVDRLVKVYQTIEDQLPIDSESHFREYVKQQTEAWIEWNGASPLNYIGFIYKSDSVKEYIKTCNKSISAPTKLLQRASQAFAVGVAGTDNWDF